MTESPVNSLIMKMAIPTIIGNLVSALYNIVDTFYVGTLSTSATAAVGLVFPYMALTQAIALFFGQGSGNYISRALGKKDIAGAGAMASVGFFTALAMGIILATAGIYAITPLAQALGATYTLLTDTKDYLFFTLISTPIFMCTLVLNCQMRLQGNAFFGMIGIASGAIINAAIDPIFIFALDMGVKGASLATLIAQSISLIILFVTSRMNGGIKIGWKNFILSFGRLKEIAGGGFPSLCRQGLGSVAIICLNYAAKMYGDSAIAAFTVVSRIGAIAMAILIGFGQGFQPVCGFNYGAGLYLRVRKAFWFSAKIGVAYTSILCAIGIIFAPSIIAIFRDEDPILLQIGVEALRYQALTFPLIGWTTIVNMFLQNIRKTFSASLLAMAREGIFLLPLILILPEYCGLVGVEISRPLADFMTFCLASLIGLKVIKTMPQNSTTENNK